SPRQVGTSSAIGRRFGTENVIVGKDRGITGIIVIARERRPVPGGDKQVVFQRELIVNGACVDFRGCTEADRIVGDGVADNNKRRAGPIKTLSILVSHNQVLNNDAAASRYTAYE